jgi:two-component system, NarL family, nitrate/nitrite response regulator NarL
MSDCGTQLDTTLGEDHSPVAGARPAVFVVSDVRLYREGLAFSLSRRAELEVVGAAALGPDALTAIARCRPQAALLDFTTPHAIEWVRQLDHTVPGIKIVAFAVGEIDHELIACAEAGIAGFVTRDGSVDDIVRAVLNAQRGDIDCSPRIAGLLFRHVASLSEAKRDSAPRSALTRREREIAALVNEGLSNKEIARLLRIGAATVKNHVHNILEKLHVSRRGEAAARLRGEMTANGSGQASAGLRPKDTGAGGPQ